MMWCSKIDIIDAHKAQQVHMRGLCDWALDRSQRMRKLEEFKNYVYANAIWQTLFAWWL